jgi:hypothetical protein
LKNFFAEIRIEIVALCSLLAVEQTTRMIWIVALVRTTKAVAAQRNETIVYGNRKQKRVSSGMI